jgi:hypothetical protein
VYRLVVTLNRAIDCLNMNGDAVHVWQTLFFLFRLPLAYRYQNFPGL